MNNIPYTSYIFIGITTFVLTYATIADTTNEIIITPEPTSQEAVEETVKVEETPETVEVEEAINPSGGGKKRKTKHRRKKHKKSRKSKN